MANVYATWNPSDKGSDITLTNGDLNWTHGASAFSACRATIGKTTGKWYWEITATSWAVNQGPGVANGSASMNNFIGADANGWCFFDGGSAYNGAGASSWPGSFVPTNTVMFAVDLTASKIWIGVNGTWAAGNPALGTSPQYSNLSGTIYPAICAQNTSVCTANFGATAFAYTPPGGFNPGWYTPASTGLFTPAPLNGLGSGGSLLTNRVG